MNEDRVWENFNNLSPEEKDKIVGLHQHCGCVFAAEDNLPCKHDFEDAIAQGLLKDD